MIYETFKEWQQDKECQSTYVVAGLRNDERTVKFVECKVCTEYFDKIRGRKSFSDKCVYGVGSVQISDDACNDQYTHAGGDYYSRPSAKNHAKCTCGRAFF